MYNNFISYVIRGKRKKSCSDFVSETKIWEKKAFSFSAVVAYLDLNKGQSAVRYSYCVDYTIISIIAI
jgi:hypothetical protein